MSKNHPPIPLRYKMLVAPLAFYAVGTVGLGLRDTLPEPWDVADHMGNVATTIGVAGWAALRKTGGPTSVTADYSESKARFQGGVVGTAAGVVVGSLIDYKTGISAYDSFMAPDFVDFVYGAVAGTVAGVTVPLSANEVSSLLQREAPEAS